MAAGLLPAGLSLFVAASRGVDNDHWPATPAARSSAVALRRLHRASRCSRTPRTAPAGRPCRLGTGEGTTSAPPPTAAGMWEKHGRRDGTAPARAASRASAGGAAAPRGRRLPRRSTKGRPRQPQRERAGGRGARSPPLRRARQRGRAPPSSSSGARPSGAFAASSIKSVHRDRSRAWHLMVEIRSRPWSPRSATPGKARRTSTASGRSAGGQRRGPWASPVSRSTRYNESATKFDLAMAPALDSQSDDLRPLPLKRAFSRTSFAAAARARGGARPLLQPPS